MKLHAPFEISARLLPAVRIGKSWISIEAHGETSDGRTRYRYHIDTPDFEYTGSDLKSGVGGGDLAEGMASLLAFLSACAESRSYGERTGRAGENADLFPDNVGQWAQAHSDEIGMLQLEIEESQLPLIEA